MEKEINKLENEKELEAFMETMKEEINEEFLASVSGGSVEETKELLEWCNRHGAGITRSADNPYVSASIFYFLVTEYPELHLYGGHFNTVAPNYIDGYDHKRFMALLREKYGD